MEFINKLRPRSRKKNYRTGCLFGDKHKCSCKLYKPGKYGKCLKCNHGEIWHQRPDEIRPIPLPKISISRSNNTLLNQLEPILLENEKMAKSLIRNKKNINNINEKLICCICFTNEINIAAYPCGHAKFCKTCINIHKQTNNKCPMCRTIVKRYRKIII